MKWQPINEFDFETDAYTNVVFRFWHLPPRVGYCSVSGWRYEDHNDGHIQTFLILDLDHAKDMGITHFLTLDEIPGEPQL
mgnify:CR=1 FL=1